MANTEGKSLFVYEKNNDLSNVLDLTFELPKNKIYCFNHYSVIQNFFNNAIISYSYKPNEIPHHHDKQDTAKGFVKDKDKHRLEDFSDVDNVLKAFRNWLSSCYSKPKVLHAHGIYEDDYGNVLELNATWNALNRFQSDRNIKPLSQALDNYKGKGVFLTLTVDHSKVKGLKDAWQNISKRWNIFMTRLSKELNVPRKDIHYIWVLEAQGNGYPHIHALFLGIDYLFWAGNKQAWINDNPHSKNLKHFWGWGSVFVNSSKSDVNIKNPISYMMKYIRKTFTPYSDYDKKELTQALLWAFNKRSWNTSRGLMSYLHYSPKIPVVDFQLEEMVSFERLNGQSSGLVWLENTNHNDTSQSVEFYTTSNEDLDYLAEKVAMFRASKYEERALNYLISMKNKGLDVAYVFPLKNDCYHFRRHNFSL